MVLSSKQTGWQKWLIVGWAFLECMLFGGLIYGWAILVFVLKDEGIYADLCQTNNIVSNMSANPFLSVGTTTTIAKSVQGQPFLENHSSTTDVIDMDHGLATTEETDNLVCEPQDERMALCFTVASAVTCLSCAVMGHLNYNFGTMFNRLIAFGIFGVGTLMMAFVSIDVPWLMFPGLTLMGIGGVPLLVTDIQISNLFRKGSVAVVGVLNGGFNLSSAVLLLVKVTHQNGFSRQHMLLIIAGLHCLTLVSTFWFLPKMFISFRSADSLEEMANESIDITYEPSTEKDVESSLVADSGGHNAHVNGKTSTPSLFRCIVSPAFLLHCIWVSFLQLKYHYYMSSLNTYLNRILDGNKEEVSYFTDVFSYTMVGNLPVSILSGLLYDWQRKICKERKSSLYRELKPAILPLAACSTVFVVLSILSLIQSQSVIYVSFIFVVFARCSLYTIAHGFLYAVFPVEYFGFLFGVMLIAGGSISFLQYAFFAWTATYPEGPLHADICMLILVIITAIHPIYIWKQNRKEERKCFVAKNGQLQLPDD